MMSLSHLIRNVIGSEGIRRILSLTVVFVISVLAQVYSLWNFRGDKVDESELVLFAVGFLGGDLDPVWDGYGHLGMYMLGLIYYIDGLSSVLFGEAKSFTEYASSSLSSHRFYKIGRVFLFVPLGLFNILGDDKYRQSL